MKYSLKHLLLTSICINTKESIFYLVPLFALFIPTYNCLIKISSFFLELISRRIKGARQGSVDVDIEIQDDIWEQFPYSTLVYPENHIDTESLSFSLDSTGGEKRAIRDNNISSIKNRFHNHLKCLRSCSRIEIGICEWMHLFIFPLFPLG